MIGTAKTRKRLLFVIGGIAVVAFLVLHYEERDHYGCQICFSRKSVIQWRLVAWADASIPLTPSWEAVTGTRFLHDFFPTNHVHDWQFAQGSPYHLFGTTWAGCAIGGGRHISPLCELYESSLDFRTFIQTKINDSSLAKSNVIALMSIPSSDKSSTLRAQANALLEGFLRRIPP